MYKLYNDNAKLIELLKNGNEDAYTYLVTFYHKPLFVYALSLNNDKISAEDLIQNVFLKIWEHRKRLNPQYSIKSFLYKTTYNEFINQYHKKRKISILERAYVEALDEIIDDGNAELLEQKINLVTKGIAKLPRKCKKTFLLSKKEGLSNIEIAEHLDISIRTVETQLSKAYKLLREQIGSQLKTILFFMFNINIKKNTSSH